MRYKIIDNLTGQVTDTESLHPETMTGEGYLIPARKGGSRSFRAAIMPRAVTIADKGALWELATYHTVAGVNLIGHRTRQGFTGYSALQIGELVGFKSRSTRSRFLNKMLRLRVMHKIKDTRGQWLYFLNPAYYIAPGWRLSATLYSFFTAELDPLLPDNIRKEFQRRAPEGAMFGDDAISGVEDILSDYSVS